jgi:iron(III) transport system ATP-binding protein
VASVELRGLTKRFGALGVVDEVSLRIDHGQLVCLLGPSGCGKTTTLRLIAGFLEPTLGEIHVGERVVSSPAKTVPPENRKMSMIFQSYALWPHMTVAENIVYGLRLRKLDRDTIAKKLAAILATTKLEPLAQRYPGELSGGQQQRVALARALIVEPQTLLLDEPLSNLDANLREEMRFEIRRLHDQYRYTTVYVTHDQSEAMTTADLIAVMNAGKIDQLGSPEDIYDRPQSEFVARFIGASNVIKGTARDENHVAFGGTSLQVVGTKLPAGATVPVAIRQHDIQLSTQAPGNPQNALKGRDPRLSRRGRRRHGAARRHGTGQHRDGGSRSLAHAAAGTLPGLEALTTRKGARDEKAFSFPALGFEGNRRARARRDVRFAGARRGAAD